MYSVKIYGAGSIGNHLSHASRTKGWKVSVCDIDKSALERMKSSIYPQRYGEWDENINLFTNDEISIDNYYDIVIIGTPPESHIPIALQEIKSNNPPKIILIEKPLTVPSLIGCQELVDLSRQKNITVLCGYNHTLTQNSKYAKQLILNHDLKNCNTIHVQWLEHWGGIFDAHPWLDGPKDSYLGYSSKGGGSTYEHSHGINIWQHFSKMFGSEKIIEVSAVMKTVKKDGIDYDETTQLIVKTNNGITGTIVQDVITNPPIKKLKLQCDNANIEWEANKYKNIDSLTINNKEKLFKKIRPDDFVGEVNHLEELIQGKIAASNSPISLERGIETMMVAIAASISSEKGKKVTIDYSKGCCYSAFSYI